MSKPVVVIIGLQYADMFERIYHHFLSALQKKADVRKVASKLDALRYLSSPSPPHAVLLCDAAITEKEFRDVLDSLVSYVKRGGTAVCMGVFSGWASPDDLTAMFATSWGLPWSFETYRRYDWVVSPCPKGLDVKGLATAYSMKAVILSNVPVESAVYFDPYYAEQLRKGKGKVRAVLQESCECTAAFAAVGEGYFGYVGDVNGEPETTAVILAMTFHPAVRSKAPVSLATQLLATPDTLLTVVRRQQLPLPLRAQDHRSRMCLSSLWRKPSAQRICTTSSTVRSSRTRL